MTVTKNALSYSLVNLLQAGHSVEINPDKVSQLHDIVLPLIEGKEYVIHLELGGPHNSDTEVVVPGVFFRYELPHLSARDCELAFYKYGSTQIVAFAHHYQWRDSGDPDEPSYETCTIWLRDVKKT